MRAGREQGSDNQGLTGKGPVTHCPDPTFLKVKGDSLKNHILGKMRHKTPLLRNQNKDFGLHSKCKKKPLKVLSKEVL